MTSGQGHTSSLTTRSDDMTRLCSLATQGDTEAARRLLVAARRLGDDATCMEACRVLVAGGQWREALAYYGWCVEALQSTQRSGYNSMTGRMQDDTPRVQADCHELCNAIRSLWWASWWISTSILPIVRLFVRARRLWYPDGWLDHWGRHQARVNDSLYSSGSDCGVRYLKIWRYTDAHDRRLVAVIPEIGSVNFASTLIHPRMLNLPDTPECVCLEAGEERGACPDGTLTEAPLGTWCCETCNGTGRCPRCGHMDWSDIETKKERSQDGHYIHKG